jgi:hypothetical protein
MRRIPRSILLPFILTAVTLFAAAHLGVTPVKIPEARAQTCPNTECYGWQMCRYNRYTVCAIHTRDGPCTIWRCP